MIKLTLHFKKESHRLAQLSFVSMLYCCKERIFGKNVGYDILKTTFLLGVVVENSGNVASPTHF
jgi:hypothetical protein